MQKRRRGNRKKRFYSKMWENPLGLSMFEGHMEIV